MCRFCTCYTWIIFGYHVHAIQNLLPVTVHAEVDHCCASAHISLRIIRDRNFRLSARGDVVLSNYQNCGLLTSLRDFGQIYIPLLPKEKQLQMKNISLIPQKMSCELEFITVHGKTQIQERYWLKMCYNFLFPPLAGSTTPRGDKSPGFALLVGDNHLITFFSP